MLSVEISQLSEKYLVSCSAFSLVQFPGASSSYSYNIVNFLIEKNWDANLGKTFPLLSQFLI